MRNIKSPHHTLRLALAIVLAASLAAAALAACQDTPTGETGTMATTAATTASSTSTASNTTASTGTSPGTGTAATTVAPTTASAPSATSSATQAPRPAETTVILKLEGKDEPIRATLYTSALGYSMYTDPTFYTVSQAASRFDPAQASRADRYQPIRPLENHEVYLEIGRLTGVAPAEALTRIRSALTAQYKTVQSGDPVGIGVSKTTAQTLEASDGTAQSSRMASVAVISDGKGGSFYFLAVYTRLVAEGHKARLNHLIDTFRIE